MNDFVLNQMEDWSNNAQAFAMPQPVKTVFEETVSKTNDNPAPIGALLNESPPQTGKAVNAPEDEAFDFTDRVIDNAHANMARMEKFASDIASAKSAREVANLQTEFWHTQSQALMRQSSELLQLSRAIMFPSLKSPDALMQNAPSTDTSRDQTS